MTKNEHLKIDIMNEPIAIVGVSCQFPRINKDIEDLDAFYDMLLKDQDKIHALIKSVIMNQNGDGTNLSAIIDEPSRVVHKESRETWKQ